MELVNESNTNDNLELVDDPKYYYNLYTFIKSPKNEICAICRDCNPNIQWCEINGCGQIKHKFHVDCLDSYWNSLEYDDTERCCLCRAIPNHKNLSLWYYFSWIIFRNPEPTHQRSHIIFSHHRSWKLWCIITIVYSLIAGILVFYLLEKFNKN